MLGSLGCKPGGPAASSSTSAPAAAAAPAEGGNSGSSPAATGRLDLPADSAPPTAGPSARRPLDPLPSTSVPDNTQDPPSPPKRREPPQNKPESTAAPRARAISGRDAPEIARANANTKATNYSTAPPPVTSTPGPSTARLGNEELGEDEEEGFAMEEDEESIPDEELAALELAANGEDGQSEGDDDDDDEEVSEEGDIPVSPSAADSKGATFHSPDDLSDYVDEEIAPVHDPDVVGKKDSLIAVAAEAGAAIKKITRGRRTPAHQATEFGPVPANGWTKPLGMTYARYCKLVEATEDLVLKHPYYSPPIFSPWQRVARRDGELLRLTYQKALYS